MQVLYNQNNYYKLFALQNVVGELNMAALTWTITGNIPQILRQYFYSTFVNSWYINKIKRYTHKDFIISSSFFPAFSFVSVKNFFTLSLALITRVRREIKINNSGVRMTFPGMVLVLKDLEKISLLAFKSEHGRPNSYSE